MTPPSWLWVFPWFSGLIVPGIAIALLRGARGAAALAVGLAALAGLWWRQGCPLPWVLPPAVAAAWIAWFVVRLEREFRSRSQQLSAQERRLSEQVKRSREEMESLKSQVEERELAIHEISQLYDLSKRFLGTLEAPEAFRITEESIARWLPQSSLSDRQVYLQKIKSRLAQDDKILAGDLIQTMPMSGSDRTVRERWSIVGEQLALGLQRVQLYAKVQESATHDGLTGLLVRRHFREQMENEIRRAHRRSAPLCFLMIDLDRFKSVNDTYGHLVGDVVLRETATLVRGCVREMDLVGRYGGEEFSVVLPEAGPALGLQIAERIRRTMEEATLSAYDETLQITVSIGMAFYPDGTASAADLIERADQALYRAKASGRNRTVVAEEDS